MTIRLALAVTLLFFAACQNASASQFRVLHSFCAQTNCTDGGDPESGLIADSDGNLYGTATRGGTMGGGVVYELVRGKHGDWVYQVLYNFCSQQKCFDGFDPRNSLIIDTAGNLYGTTRRYSVIDPGPSSIFELSPDESHTHWSFEILHSFCLPQNRSCPNYPVSALTYAGQASGAPYDGTSALYGYEETIHGDNPYYEFEDWIFRYLPNGHKGTFSQIFSAGDGFLEGDPLLGNDGFLYGTMPRGGQYKQGEAFAYNPTTHASTVLHDFCAQPQCSDGGLPSGGLMLDAAGTVYGNAEGGSPTSYCLAAGFSSCGIVFSLTPQNGQYTYSILHDLCGKPNCSDGMGPQSSLISDVSGTLYGVSFFGGGNPGDTGWGGGTVFEANGDVERALHKFCSEAKCADGEYPNGPLLMDAKGNLYGTTTEGGAYYNSPGEQSGTVFEITR
jgi:hypothetical protein